MYTRAQFNLPPSSWAIRFPDSGEPFFRVQLLFKEITVESANGDTAASLYPSALVAPSDLVLVTRRKNERRKMKRVSESEWKKGLSSPRLAQPGCNQQRVWREGQWWPLQCRSDKRGDIVRPRPYISFSFSFSLYPLPLSLSLFLLVFLLPFFTRERTRVPSVTVRRFLRFFTKRKLDS